MGYDVSFHPISPDEIQEWYFTPLTWIQQGQEEKVLALATQYGIEDFYAEKYLDTLRVGSETESNELFDKSHGFYIAVIQGFFRDYYSGTAPSKLSGCWAVTAPQHKIAVSAIKPETLFDILYIFFLYER